MVVSPVKEKIAKAIDQTLLDPSATQEDYEQFIRASAFAGFHTLFVPPIYLPEMVKTLEHSKTLSGAIVGFPMGWDTRKEKLYQLNQALSSKADEVDFVLNISKFKSGDISYVKDELKAIREESLRFKNKFGKNICLKCIIECCLLNDDEKKKIVEILINERIAFVKTSTGKNKSGAAIKDVELLKANSKGLILVKAAGGIRNLSEVRDMLDAGASRIGTSSGLDILKEIK